MEFYPDCEVWADGHVSGTCRMGADDDAMAVCDSRLRVRGVDNLRVVDASVFPYVTNGNIYAPVMMVAEKAADLVKLKEHHKTLGYRLLLDENVLIEKGGQNSASDAFSRQPDTQLP